MPGGLQSEFSGQAVKLVPASTFSLSALTDIYNRTRVDYLIPMQMDPAHLEEYLRLYDVDPRYSWVAVDGEKVLGLAMLGVRPGRTWVTRLGVVPGERRHGLGENLVRALIQSTLNLGSPVSILEVIKGNSHAHDLFYRVGFREIRELLVLRRPSGSPLSKQVGNAAWGGLDSAITLLSTVAGVLPWTNQVETFTNAGDGQSLQLDLGNAGSGWVVFRYQESLLSHFVFHTQSGEPHLVAAELLAHLYHHFQGVDTYLENIPVADVHLPALWQAGFQEAFRRIEMRWNAAERLTE